MECPSTFHLAFIASVLANALFLLAPLSLVFFLLAAGSCFVCLTLLFTVWHMDRVKMQKHAPVPSCISPAPTLPPPVMHTIQEIEYSISASDDGEDAVTVVTGTMSSDV